MENARPSADRLLEFKTIVESGSIAAAARQLQLPRPTLSRRLSELEELLGVRLLQRSTRRLHLTPIGNDLYLRAARVIEDIDAAWDAIRQHDEEPRGPLRISVPGEHMAASRFFLDFAAEFPKVELDVVVVNRGIDLYAQRIDAALHFGDVRDPNLIVRRLTADKRIATASLEYLERYGTPKTIEEIRDHRCVVLRDYDGHLENRWPLVGGGHLQVRSHFSTSAFVLMTQAVHRGLGIGLIPARDSEKHTNLRALFPEQIQVVDAFSIVCVERDFQLPQVRAFIDRAEVFWRKWAEDWSTEYESTAEVATNAESSDEIRGLAR